MAGYQASIYAAIYITMTVAVVALGLRLKARQMTQVKLWFDDYFAIIAFIFSIGYCTALTVGTRYFSLGVDLTLSDDNAEYTLERSRLVLWIGSLTYASSIAASKISFLSFYWRLFKFTSIRIPLQILFVTASVWYVVRTFVTILQCLPVPYIWDKNIHDGYCAVDQSKFFFGSVLVHCLLDVIILVLPIFPISSMHLSFTKKLGVVALFSSGAIVCIASVFVLIESITFHQTPDSQPAAVARNWFWAAVEVNMAIFSGSLPMLRPVINKLFPQCMLSADDTSTNGGGGFRLSHVSEFRRSPSKHPSWTELNGHGSPEGGALGHATSGGSTVPVARAHLAAAGADDFDDDDFYDDASDPWQIREQRDASGDHNRYSTGAKRDGDMRVATASGRGDGSPV